MSRPFSIFPLALFFADVRRRNSPKRFSCDSEFSPLQRKKIARSKQRNTFRARIYRKRVKDLRGSFRYILNLESRDTYSDPGTGFKISKHSVAPKTGIKALSTLILSNILKASPPEHLPAVSTRSIAIQVTDHVMSPKSRIITQANPPDPNPFTSSSNHIVQLENPDDDYDSEIPPGEPS